MLFAVGHVNSIDCNELRTRMLKSEHRKDLVVDLVDLGNSIYLLYH